MEDNSSAWSFITFFVIIRDQISGDICKLVLIVSVRFARQYYRVPNAVNISEQSVPRVEFTMKVNLGNRVSFIKILTFLLTFTPRSPLGIASFGFVLSFVGIVYRGVFIEVLIGVFFCAVGSSGRG